MTTKTLNRSSMLLIISGILLVIGVLFHPDMSEPGYAAAPGWIPVHIIMGFSTLFGFAGLAALLAVMNLNIRPFGRTAFGLALLGNLLLTGIMFFFEASVLPVLARNQEYLPLLSENGPLMTGPLGTMIGISMFIASLGYLLLAGYLVSSRTISLVNGILFLGAPLLLFTPPLPSAAGTIGGLLLGAAIIWLGVSVRMGLAHLSLASSLRIQDECFSHVGGHA